MASVDKELSSLPCHESDAHCLSKVSWNSVWLNDKQCTAWLICLNMQVDLVIHWAQMPWGWLAWSGACMSMKIGCLQYLHHFFFWNVKNKHYILFWRIAWCLMPLSIIFQLFQSLSCVSFQYFWSPVSYNANPATQSAKEGSHYFHL